MAIVIDDRLDVWDEKDKRHVHNLPAYNPSVATEDKVIYLHLNAGGGVLAHRSICSHYTK
jgi:hypothetical protein